MSQNFVISLLKALRNVVHSGFWLGLWGFGLAVWLWYLLRWWSGDHFFPVRLAGYFLPWLPVGLIPGLVVAGLARRKWLSLALTGPGIFIGLTFAPFFLPSSNNTPPTSPILKIMSYNLWLGNQNVLAISEVIRQEQPDILLLQELNPAIAQTLFDELSNLFPDSELYFDFVQESEHEFPFFQAVISRYPLMPISVEADKGRVQKVMVETPTGPLAVWNVHPVPPIYFGSQHCQQLSALAADIAAVDGPLIVGGDFNITNQSELYQSINRYLGNAHREAGWGLDFTFPASPHTQGLPVATGPLYRLDHIFYSRHFFAHSAQTLTESGGSDHLPVAAKLGAVK